jgi:hypothetical protein
MTAGTLKAIYAIPLRLSIVTAVGLLSALLGDGIWDVLSWMLLAVPLSLLLSYLVAGGRRA